MEPWLISLICIAAGGVFSGIFVIFFVAWRVFTNTMYRSPKKPRTRECSDESVPDHKRMFAEGIAWSERYKGITEDLHIINGRYNLYGQYVNFGYGKCAVVLQGRTESLLYSYYFAGEYAKAGHNILVIDSRAHGLSDGKFVTSGVLEYKDLIMWLELVKEKYGIEAFTVHGICMGGAGALYAYSALKKENKNWIKKVVFEGMYYSYYEIFRLHHIERKKPVFPFVYLVFFIAYLCTGARLFKKTPYKYIKNLDIPVLFIWSEEDFYCKKERNEALFAACPSEYKHKAYFPKGKHSHVRINQTAAYDQAIAEFLKKYNEHL